MSNTSDSARRAAEEICAYFGDTELAMSGHVNTNGVATIISKHFAAAPTDNDAESLLPELTAVFVTNAIRVHTLSNHGCKWHDCLADVCYNNKELIQRAQGEQPTTTTSTTTKGDR